MSDASFREYRRSHSLGANTSVSRRCYAYISCKEVLKRWSCIRSFISGVIPFGSTGIANQASRRVE